MVAEGLAGGSSRKGSILPSAHWALAWNAFPYTNIDHTSGSPVIAAHTTQIDAFEFANEVLVVGLKPKQEVQNILLQMLSHINLRLSDPADIARVQDLFAMMCVDTSNGKTHPDCKPGRQLPGHKTSFGKAKQVAFADTPTTRSWVWDGSQLIRDPRNSVTRMQELFTADEMTAVAPAYVSTLYAHPDRDLLVVNLTTAGAEARIRAPFPVETPGGTQTYELRLALGRDVVGPSEIDVVIPMTGQTVTLSWPYSSFGTLEGWTDTGISIEIPEAFPIVGTQDVLIRYRSGATTRVLAALFTTESCTLSSSPTDCDSDGEADSCVAPPDMDSDGICDARDNCVSIANSQRDSDSDGLGNECDPCFRQMNHPNPAVDSDFDGFCDLTDNCPNTPNPGQEDYPDQDGVGNACDADDDNDGVADVSDKCPTYPSGGGNHTDADGDGRGQECDCNDNDPTDTIGPGCTDHILLSRDFEEQWDLVFSAVQALQDLGIDGPFSVAENLDEWDACLGCAHPPCNFNQEIYDYAVDYVREFLPHKGLDQNNFLGLINGVPGGNPDPAGYGADLFRMISNNCGEVTR